jgi:hypothetical protein
MCGMNQLTASTTMDMIALPWQSCPPKTIDLPSKRAWHRLRAAIHAAVQAAIERLGGMVGPVPRSDDRIASWALAADAASVPRARRLTRARLTAWQLEELSDVTELLVSELVTNALRHAPGPCRLTISALDGLLRCEVEDSSHIVPKVHYADEFDEGGRGLHLLELLACCWGAARTPGGKAMWFELPTGVTDD